MDIVNQKIIDAIIAKANMVCPNSLALIGVYGSVATGDVYNKSDNLVFLSFYSCVMYRYVV